MVKLPSLDATPLAEPATAKVPPGFAASILPRIVASPVVSGRRSRATSVESFSITHLPAICVGASPASGRVTRSVSAQRRFRREWVATRVAGRRDRKLVTAVRSGGRRAARDQRAVDVTSHHDCVGNARVRGSRLQHTSAHQERSETRRGRALHCLTYGPAVATSLLFDGTRELFTAVAIGATSRKERRQSEDERSFARNSHTR